MRQFLKSVLPVSVRRVLRAGLHYVQRLGVWVVLLWHVRGVTWRDEWVLLKSALASPATALRDILKWQDPLLLDDADVRVPGIGVFHVRNRTDDLWHVLPSREQTVLDTIINRLKTGDVFVDAGANIGVYTVLAARLVGPGGRVIAVEMMPETAKILREHISINRLENVDIIEQALADTAGKEVVARVPTGQHGQASIVNGVASGEREVRVTTTTLADVLADLGHIALMKLDLEGAEELALRGTGDALNRVRAVIFEDWGETRLTEIFLTKGFSVERLDGNNCLGTNMAHG